VLTGRTMGACEPILGRSFRDIRPAHHNVNPGEKLVSGIGRMI
jgi:hypothetical protein